MKAIFALFLISLKLADSASTWTTRSKPQDCEKLSNEGDHVRIQFSIKESGSEIALEIKNNVLAFRIGSDEVLPGLEQGLLGMCTGETRSIVAEPQDAYGSEGAGTRLPFIGDQLESLSSSTIIFTVTLNQLATEEEFGVFDCIASGDANCAMRVLKGGADITLLDRGGNTPLMAAVNKNMMQVVAMILNQKPKQMPLSSYVNVAKSSGHTALFYACQHEDPSLVKALLKRGADPNAKLSADSKSPGWTPMHFAVSFERHEQLKLMLNWGGDPYAMTDDGMSIMDVSREHTYSFRNRVMDYLNEAIDDMEEREEEMESRALGGGSEL